MSMGTYTGRRTHVDCVRSFPRHVTKDEAWENLANAIIIQAVVDYQCLLMDLPPLYTSGHMGRDKLSITDCEVFFRSQYFETLTKVPGEFLIDYCRKKVRRASGG